MDTTIKRHIEALIFATNEPITLAEIKLAIDTAFQMEVDELKIEAFLEEIKIKYAAESFVFQPVEIAGGYQFLTKSDYHETIGEHLKQKSQKRLSRAALETLSIIAYKQPVPRSEIEKIRGVNCDYAVSKLLEKELVAIVGRSDAPGRPLLYGTSAKFMDYFGIQSIKDLPKLKEFKPSENEIGAPEEIEVEN